MQYLKYLEYLLKKHWKVLNTTEFVETEIPAAALIIATILCAVGASLIQNSSISIGVQNILLHGTAMLLCCSAIVVIILRLHKRDVLFRMLGFPVIFSLLLLAS
ncbi:MAG: hypothetical protein V4478_01820 [Patescibacteria group bacterium]